MSISKFEKPDRELISRVDVDSSKFSAKPSRCSCINCDFIGCSKKRKNPVDDQDKKSPRDNCQNLQNCVPLPDNVSASNADLESGPKRVIREIVTRETIHRLKRVTETMYNFHTNQNLGMFTVKQSDVSDKTEIPTSVISKPIECCKKRLIDTDAKSGKDDCCRKNLISQSNISSKNISTLKTSEITNNIDCCKESSIDDIGNSDGKECCGKKLNYQCNVRMKKMPTPRKSVISNNISIKKSSIEGNGNSDKNVFCGENLSSQNNNSSKKIPTLKKRTTSAFAECCKEIPIEGNGNSNKNDFCKTNLVSQSNISSKKIEPNKSVISNNRECYKKSSIADKWNNDKNEFCRKNLLSQSNISSKKIPTPNKSVISNNTEYCKKSFIDDKGISTKNECWRKNLLSVSNMSLKNENDSIRQVENPDTDGSLFRKEDNTATELSAQVMNVPYEDLHESDLSTQELTKQSPLTKINLFKRIKEIYEACSCKVCECISSTPREIRDDFCKCKPCQCQDCVKLRTKIEENIRHIPHSGCPCIRCDRCDCKGIVKNTCALQVCDCNPSDSHVYTDDLTKLCNCKPCECIDCRLFDLHASKTVKLGQADEIIQRESCHCSPCECIKCQNIYNHTKPAVMCTYATNRTKYCNDDRYNNCHISRYQLAEIDTRKHDGHDEEAKRISYNKNHNDYDIRTVIIGNKGFLNQQTHIFKEPKTVAMFACLNSNSCEKGVCKCTECECIVCSNRNNSFHYRQNLRHNVMAVHNDTIMPMPITDTCKCTLCECEICSKIGEREEDSIRFESSNKCRCNICDCLNCDNASLLTSSLPSSSITPYGIHESQTGKRIKNMVVNKNCDCNPCHCRNCKKLFSCSSRVKYYSNGKCVERNTTQRLRKVMLITPTSSESHFKTKKLNIRNISSNNLSPKHSTDIVFGQDLSSCHAVSHNFTVMKNLPSKSKDQFCQLYQNNEEYNVISDEDFGRHFFSQLNNPVVDTVKSIEEPQILTDNPLNFAATTFQPYKIVNRSQDLSTKAKLKGSDGNLIQLDKIRSNNSDESLPVYWTCRNYTYLPSNCQNVDTTRSKLNDDETNLHLYKIKKSKIKQDELIDNTKESEDQFLIDNDEMKFGEIIRKKFENSYTIKDHIDIKCLRQKPQKYIASLSSRNINSNNNEGYRNSVDNKSNVTVTIDYERATRVLSEAKAFSSKLMTMLDSFETANRQFESASQKFKTLHKSLLDINENKLNNCGANLKKSNVDDTFENMFQICCDSNIQATSKSKENVNEAEKEYKQSEIKSNEIYDSLQYTQNYNTVEMEHIDKTNIKIRNNTSHENDIDALHDIKGTNDQFQEVFNKADEHLPTSKSPYLRISDSANRNLCRVDLDNKAINGIEDKDGTNTIHRPSLATVMNKLDSVFGNISTADSAVVTSDRETNLVQLSKQDDKKPWPIFEKNLYLNSYPKNRRTIFETPPLEINIKEAVQAISQQAMVNRHKTISSPNEALTNLQSEVSDLLNMPLLQPTSKYKFRAVPETQLFSKNKLDLEVKSMSSTASCQTYEPVERADKAVYFNNNLESIHVSCEQFKATFVGLRRVSDHTVLVKWSVPPCLNDVQGYELLVDGRAVQKILSPRRNMAVVTCLPHAARVILTIRTVTSAAVDCGHAPSTSIVYRPRMK